MFLLSPKLAPLNHGLPALALREQGLAYWVAELNSQATKTVSSVPERKYFLAASAFFW
jgi:hypothetical protein